MRAITTIENIEIDNEEFYILLDNLNEEDKNIIKELNIKYESNSLEEIKKSYNNREQGK